jgi:hypothetical protein
MKLEATRLTKAQRCEIIAKLSKPNVLRKQALGWEYEVSKGVQPIETFAESESATNFKGFEALHNIVLNINDQLLCSDVQTEAKQMYDELQRSFKTFWRNFNKLTFNVKHKKFMHSLQMTLHDMFKQ